MPQSLRYSSSSIDSPLIRVQSSPGPGALFLSSQLDKNDFFVYRQKHVFAPLPTKERNPPFGVMTMKNIRRSIAITNIIGAVLFIFAFHIPVWNWKLYSSVTDAEVPTAFAISFLAWEAIFMITNVWTAISDKTNVLAYASVAAFITMYICLFWCKPTEETHATYTILQNVSGYLHLIGGFTFSLLLAVLPNEHAMKTYGFKAGEV